MRVHLQTRGTARAADYAFLGGAPPQAWWRSFRDVTAFDHPTVLVTSGGGRWAAYLSGIPSARLDAVGTVVRYTLVLDGPWGAADAACVAAAVAAWLDDVAAGYGDRPGGRLTTALDARFPLADVERWLDPAQRHSRRTGSDERPSRQNADPDGVADEVADERAVGQAGAAFSGERIGDDVPRRVLAALAGLPVPSEATDEPGDWIGAVGAPAPRAAFVARVAALVHGARGRALLLNLAGGPADAQPLLDPASPVAVLVESADPQLARCTALRPVVGAKKAVPPPARRAGAAVAAGIAVLPLVVLIGTLAAAALVVTLLFWLL